MAENKPAVPQEDNLVKDLTHTLTGAGLSHIQKQIILEKLVPYIVGRDHKILTHGIKTGRASA